MLTVAFESRPHAHWAVSCLAELGRSGRLAVGVRSAVSGVELVVRQLYRFALEAIIAGHPFTAGFACNTGHSVGACSGPMVFEPRRWDLVGVPKSAAGLDDAVGLLIADGAHQLASRSP